jgi:hypothetical protein
MGFSEKWLLACVGFILLARHDEAIIMVVYPIETWSRRFLYLA